MSRNFGLALSFCLASLVCGPLGAASAQDADVIDLMALTCRDYLLMDGDERANTAVFLHGFVSGAKSETKIDVSSLSEASDKAINSCIDAPESQLMTIFEKSRG